MPGFASRVLASIGNENAGDCDPLPIALALALAEVLALPRVLGAILLRPSRMTERVTLLRPADLAAIAGVDPGHCHRRTYKRAGSPDFDDHAATAGQHAAALAPEVTAFRA